MNIFWIQQQCEILSKSWCESKEISVLKTSAIASIPL